MPIAAVNGFTSHLPLLVACAMQARGPVVECGAGHYSTPILRSICKVRGVPLISLDECEEWADAMTEAYDGTHVVRWCLDIPAALSDMTDTPDIVFIDNGAFKIVPLMARRLCLDVAADRGVRIATAHDTEPIRRHKYQFDAGFARFKYRVDFAAECYRLSGEYPAVPWASAASNTDDLSWLADALPQPGDPTV